MTWEDAIFIAYYIGAVVFAAYLITVLYSEDCTDACEREYYSGPEYTSYIKSTRVELDPGDEQPEK